MSGHVDILFSNEAEILSLYEGSTLDEALAAARKVCPIVIVTRSANGSLIAAGEETVKVEPIPISKVVDTTGAGDQYAAGFLFAHARGRSLAEWMGSPFIELDRLVERDYGARTTELIEMAGLATFRRYERACLERVIEEHAAAVIATAGGIVSNAETYALLLRRTHTVWLQARPEEHMSRVMEQGDFHAAISQAVQ